MFVVGANTTRQEVGYHVFIVNTLPAMGAEFGPKISRDIDLYLAPLSTARYKTGSDMDAFFFTLAMSTTNKARRIWHTLLKVKICRV